MNKKMNDFNEVIAKISFTTCGNVACIHNIDSKCILKKCDLYEKGLEQEH